MVVSRWRHIDNIRQPQNICQFGIGTCIRKMSKFLIFMALAMIWVAIWTNECNAAHPPPLDQLGPLFSSFIRQELEFVCIH